MIHYALTCEKGHAFDSWFKSSDAYTALKQAGHVACTICGSTDVRRALMAPAVSTTQAVTAPEKPKLDTPQNDTEQALSAMRRHVEENSDYVGLSFAKEARAIHDGDAPERSIYGEAKPDEAKKLIEDGVPVAPLPFLPKRKTN